MTIDEAIKSLEARVEYGRKNYPSFDTFDVQLGIEALKQLQGLRNLPYGSPLPPLPGETED